MAHRLLQHTLPLVLIPLVILQLVQIPIALSLARRIKRHENERSRLLERALSVSDRERVRFAADLHDGPIQDLAGISYALGAVAPTVVDRHAPLMARVQDALQRSIESLRGLMTDLYPPDLRSGNLAQTITTLADQLRETGMQVELDLGDVSALSEEGVATLYRVARESLANVQKHAQASTVRITLGLVEGSRGTDQASARLVVADNGVGVDVSRLDRRAEGHLGLRLLADRVESMGGRASHHLRPGAGHHGPGGPAARGDLRRLARSAAGPMAATSPARPPTYGGAAGLDAGWFPHPWCVMLERQERLLLHGA